MLSDAILGFRELLEAHPELISVHLTQLVSSCVRLIGDEVYSDTLSQTTTCPDQACRIVVYAKACCHSLHGSSDRSLRYASTSQRGDSSLTTLS